MPETMSKSQRYRAQLQAMQDWDAFLLAESNLPGPRSNLELAFVVAELGDEALFLRYLEHAPEQAPVNTPAEFLPVCGVIGLGRFAGPQRPDVLARLRRCANDPRWRMREGVAMALQTLGRSHMDFLLDEMTAWAAGTALEQRAAAAALCEPALLKQPAQVQRVLDILDAITGRMSAAPDRKSEDFKALRKGMAYCWSVAVAALPDAGRPYLEKWCASTDKDIRWLVRENLKKDRLLRIDPAWVETCLQRLG